MATETTNNTNRNSDNKAPFAKPAFDASRTDSSGQRGNTSADWKTDVTNDKHADQSQKREHAGSEDAERKSQASGPQKSSGMNSPSDKRE